MKKLILIAAVTALIFGVTLVPNQKAEAAFFGPDWSSIQQDASQISTDAQILEVQAAQVRMNAEAIQALETDPEVLEAAVQIIELASQVEADAAAIVVTAEDINSRIDNSEGTTLQLAAEIGEMADRIGEMADRILWTEGQIGIMADRIVESEYLISSTSLDLAGESAELSDSGVGLAQNILSLVSQILYELG